MNKKQKRWLTFGILEAIVLALILFIVLQIGKRPQETQDKIGLILSGSKTESGWNGMHYQGMQEACDEFDVELLVKEDVKEFTGQCETAIRELIDDGAKMLILSSYGYAEEVRELVKEYPEITFYVNSSEYHDENMTSYFARIYEARYLSGILAGMKTQSGVVGYVAAMPNNEVNRGINAFTLGVRSVNPQAKVIVSWTGSWDDDETEKRMAKALIKEKQVDVITYHQNKSNVIQAADEEGIASIGFHEAFEGFSENYLTSATYDWKPVYQALVKEFLKGKGNTHTNYWLGLQDGAIKLSEFSTEVTDEMRLQVEKEIEAIRNGKAIFSGVIYDTEGNLRCDEGEMISDEMLLEQCDWYAEGVEFYE